ncbi:MAG: hypothetical protein M1819_006443 [Sarea resinae]|nr:MAG: hypothetical protein M1819_006443 [Sarea resinae]
MAEVRQLFEVNLFAVMRMCQEFIPLLIAAQGTIVQLGSLAGIMPYVFGSAYNASKAALHSYSNTLRVELEPFGVKVLTLITGGVKSQIARVERELPPTSLYNPIAASYARRVTHSQEGAMPSSAYARSVVGQILGATSPGWLASVPGLGRLGAALRRCWIFGEKGRGWIWEGKMSGLVWFVDTWLPRGTMDIVFNRMFQLSRLRGTATASPGPSSSAGAKKTV